MTRKTKAQASELERLAYEDEFVKRYPERLLDMVYYYGTYDWSKFRLEKYDTDFYLLVYEDDDLAYKFVLPEKLIEYSREVDNILSNAENEMRLHNKMIEEELRLSKLRYDAMTKARETFTEEELAVLGLK